jgi:hypothetical protein
MHTAFIYEYVSFIFIRVKAIIQQSGLVQVVQKVYRMGEPEAVPGCTSE